MKRYLLSLRGVNCQGNYKLAGFWKRKEDSTRSPPLPLEIRFPRRMFLLRRRGDIYCHWGKGVLMRWLSTQFSITKWPGTIYAPLCFPAAHPLTLLGNASLSPPLPCWVTDGFSCRQTITAEAFGCIPFVSGGKHNGDMGHVLYMFLCLFLCLLCAVDIRKEYSLTQFTLIWL